MPWATDHGGEARLTLFLRRGMKPGCRPVGMRPPVEPIRFPAESMKDPCRHAVEIPHCCRMISAYKGALYWRAIKSHAGHLKRTPISPSNRPSPVFEKPESTKRQYGLRQHRSLGWPVERISSLIVISGSPGLAVDREDFRSWSRKWAGQAHRVVWKVSAGAKLHRLHRLLEIARLPTRSFLMKRRL